MSRVALIGENSIGYVNTLIDIWNSGHCAVLLDWRIPFFTALEMMKEADVHICYIEEDLFDKTYNDSANDITFIIYKKINDLADYLPEYIYKKYTANYSRSEAIIVYSSGTTGKSKGVILSHYAINTNADAIIGYLNPTSSDCIYIAKTISHASSLTGELLVALKTRTPVVVAPIVVPPRYTLSNIEKYKVTTICINPTLLQMYVDEYLRHPDKYELSSLKEIYVHGAKASARLCEMASEVFGACAIYYEYGLTEAGPRVTSQKISSIDKCSAGKPIGSVQIMIVDEKGDEVSANEYGNIYVSTPSVYSGYVLGKTKFVSLREGWLNTGDIGYIDQNEELHIVGRSDDVMIIDAHKIYPSEVERQIIKHAQVKECAVVSLEASDKVFIGCLFVGDKEIDSIVKNRLRNVLMGFEIPKLFVKCDELPKTQNGKVSAKAVQTYLQKYVNHEKQDDSKSRTSTEIVKSKVGEAQHNESR